MNSIGSVYNKPYDKILNSFYLYPVSMLSSVDFPAPEGPIMAVNSPDFKRPLTDFKMLLVPVKKL